MPFELSGSKIVPASFFGMPLGLIALGLAWRSAAAVWRVPPLIEESLIWGGSLLWMCLFMVYLAKWLWHREAAEREFKDAVQCCFVGLAGVVALLASIGLAPYGPKLAFALFLLGSVWTLVFALYRTGCLWMGGRKPESTTPVLYLPTVAGSFVFASAATSMGHPDWAQLAFGAGVLAWIAIESVLIHRLYTAAELPPALRPTLGIQLAPPSVAAVTYLNITGGGPDIFVHALIGYALLQALILVRMGSWLWAAGPTPAWWAFSFGVAALPTAALKLLARGDTGAVGVLAPWLFTVGNLVIAAIALMTIRLLIGGRLLPVPIAAAQIIADLPSTSVTKSNEESDAHHRQG
jgi:tellurite resistance protein